jgi:UDP-N-acetylmuramate: L-alanyl-gamma-D-glutamyl-meso-diaminopimelate ligase
MRKVHLVSVSEPLVRDLALAMRNRGYEVSVSDGALSEQARAKLIEEGCLCERCGWNPDALTKDIQSVVLGAKVTKDNPEYERAKELGLLTISIPEFVFKRMKEKIRVVVAGSKGKKTIISMIVSALRKRKMAFDYAVTSEIPLLQGRVGFNHEARIALIEGDDRTTSALEKRFQLEFYRPHIAVITNLIWTSDTDHASEEAYRSTFRDFASSIEREGKLIYYEDDPIVKSLAEEIREDITAIPFGSHDVLEKDGETYLHTRYGDYPIYIPNRFFLINLNAARLACRQLGVKDADFYEAISEYSLELKS